jgi:hypothetical protein
VTNIITIGSAFVAITMSTTSVDRIVIVITSNAKLSFWTQRNFGCARPRRSHGFG